MVPMRMDCRAGCDLAGAGIETAQLKRHAQLTSQAQKKPVWCSGGQGGGADRQSRGLGTTEALGGTTQ